MGRNLVMELSTWSSLPTVEEDWDALTERGVIGVVVKSTQGARWENGWAPRVLRSAAANGLLVGVLHYCEPGYGPAELEAENVQGSLPEVELALGVWVEVDGLFGMPEHELAPWVQTALDGMQTPDARSTLICSAERYGLMAGAPFGHPWVQTTPTPELAVLAPSFAEVSGEDPSIYGASALYDVPSLRGLNAPSAWADPVPTLDVVPDPKPRHAAKVTRAAAATPDPTPPVEEEAPPSPDSDVPEEVDTLAPA